LCPDVFVSHAHQKRTAAEAVCGELEANDVTCWIAPRDIPAGSNYGECLSTALDSCRALVLVYSADANRSGHVQRELERAASRGIPILPLLLEDAPVAQALQYYVGPYQWLDVSTPPLEGHLQRVVELTSGLLVEPKPPPSRNRAEVFNSRESVDQDKGSLVEPQRPDFSGDVRPGEPIGPFRRRRPLLGVLLAAAVVIAAVLFWAQHRSRIPDAIATKINGRVEDQHGHAVPGATITIDGHVFRAISASDGEFVGEIHDARQGESMMLRATHPDFVGATVWVDHESTRPISVVMPLAAAEDDTTGP